MTTKLDLFREITDFIDYCNDFYSLEIGIYPIATKKDIETACIKYILQAKNNNLEFDSLDREKIRTILQPDYSLTLKS